MNAKERASLARLQAENHELRMSIERHMDVYRAQTLELIDLRARIEALRSVLEEKA